MKKILTLITITLLAFSLTACSGAGSEKEYNEVLENMNNMDNFTASVIINDPTYGQFTQLVKVNGNEGVVTIFDIDFYFERNDTDAVVITTIDLGHENSNYYGETVALSEVEQLTSEAFVFTVFGYEDFTYEDGKYMSDVIDFSLTDIEFTVDGDYIDEVAYTLTLGEDVLTIGVRYFNIGTTEVDIPEYVTDEDLVALRLQVQEDYPTYTLETTIEEFRLTTYDTTYVWMVGTEYMAFDQLNAAFYPETFKVVVDEETYTVEEYLALENSMGDLELFNLLVDLYRVYISEPTE